METFVLIVMMCIFGGMFLGALIFTRFHKKNLEDIYDILLIYSGMIKEIAEKYEKLVKRINQESNDGK